MISKISKFNIQKISVFIFVLVFLFVSCQVLPSILIASFTYSPTSPIADQAVQFTDTSTGGPTSWLWDFGDGITSTAQNPIHTYTAAASYTVTLNIANSSSSKSTILTITIIPDESGYYIDTNNLEASDSNPGTSALPWKTISKANQTLVAGDTVYIKAGTYTTIAPLNSGTASNRITYSNYGSDIVTVQNASYGIQLDGKSYITVRGINFYNLDKFMYLENSANHNIIAYCNFDQGRNVGWSGSEITGSSSFNWVHHCRFSKYGYYTDDDIGSILDIGDEESKTDLTSHNLIENNTMFHGGHHVLGVYGMYNVIRNNYFHNEPWSMGTSDSDRGAIMYGNRNLSLAGYPENSGRNLFEGNQIGYASDPSDSVGASGMAMNTGYNIARFNRFYHNDRAGLSLSLTRNYYSDIVYNKVYSNTFFHNGINTEDPTDHMNSGIGFGIYSGTHIIKYNVFKNNLLYTHRVPFGTYRVDLEDQVFAGNWDGDAQGDPGFVNAAMTLGDPMDANYPDLNLSANSPCIDSGSSLTTITSASGSGTTFTVSDAGYFMDGWGISGVNGDDIQIVGTSQKARITEVDYTTNSITVNTSLSWTQNQGIALVYLGSAPDIGAHEYVSPQIPRAISAKPSTIKLNRTHLIFTSTTGGTKPQGQTILVDNSGGGILNWTTMGTGSPSFLQLNPSQGTRNGVIQVEVNTEGLSPGTYDEIVVVSAPNTSNSPVSVHVTLRIVAAEKSVGPFGWFETPKDGALVYGAVPVTGWALDDVEVVRIEIKRSMHVQDAPSAIGLDGLVYVGDALFVEGARPDIEQLYESYPLSSRAGWGCMILTNCLPNQGNGSFVLYSFAYDREGNRVLLGQKTIQSDNAKSDIPFGGIDTPEQGGKVSGSAYMNIGWVLTPWPKIIPIDGAKILVWVDGISLGHPEYNNYKNDIATKFYEYVNSNGAEGYYYLDTTLLTNGLHTIAWSVRDSAGVSANIGPRFFNIINSIGTQGEMSAPKIEKSTHYDLHSIMKQPLNFQTVLVKKGYKVDSDPELLMPDDSGMFHIKIVEADRMEIDMGKGSNYWGFLLVGEELRQLPIGSTLNARTGRLSWMPGPGFLGTYDLVFIKEDGFGITRRIPIRVTIKPKFERNYFVTDGRSLTPDSA